MYKSLSIVFIILAIAAIVHTSNLFSYEKENKMDMILSTFGKNKLRNVAKNKILALIFLITTEFLISIVIISIITFSVSGMSSWSSQIQIELFTSIYNLNFLQVYLLFNLIAWVSVIAIGLLVGMINVLTQKSYLTLIVSFILMFSPLILERLQAMPVLIQKFNRIQPVFGLITVGNIQSLQIYKILFFKVLTTTAILFNGIVIIALCMLIIPSLFSFRLREK